MHSPVKTHNQLINEKSPYLLQHADNPVNWYPWGPEAFEKAKAEDKPVFLSIGYSTCHWCHVMAHESFEDRVVADRLNRHFVSIKVDKEERPDIDSVYMSVCQAFTGSGGWPTSIFMTPEQQPFFAGTYFPKTARYGSVGFIELLDAIAAQWADDRSALIKAGERIVAHLDQPENKGGSIDQGLIAAARDQFAQTYDAQWGGFGRAPKFPAPHNLLFLLDVYEDQKDAQALRMVEHTLTQMYRGGLYDHIGYGFSRYSTDHKFLVPHFEKMLYDNAWLILCYTRAHWITKNPLYLGIAKNCAAYIGREMTDPQGGFYSAQDADSDGVEGKYYVFEPGEITRILGEDKGGGFNHCYDITAQGNFEGKSIPNLLISEKDSNEYAALMPQLCEYRKTRTRLHLDDKILTSWNSMMIVALAGLYRATGDQPYLLMATRAQRFIEEHLRAGDALHVSWRDGTTSGGTTSGAGFLDDYAFYIMALLELHEATGAAPYLSEAHKLCQRTVRDFFDDENGGFYLMGQGSEPLILRPKDTYDSATPSGNSAMAQNLVRLYNLTADEQYGSLAQKQLEYLSAVASHYPAGYTAFLSALQRSIDPPEQITVVLKDAGDIQMLQGEASFHAHITVLNQPTDEYPLVNGQTTFYVCSGHSCRSPSNQYQRI